MRAEYICAQYNSFYSERKQNLGFEVGMLVPHAVFAQLPAVIAPHNDDCFLAQLQLVQPVELTETASCNPACSSSSVSLAFIIAY